MCGITGIVTTDTGILADRGMIERMRDTLTHRGPDASGAYIADGIALGHRRLSIVDVVHGQQPMYSSDGRYVIVYNGEVFNHASLRVELEAAGATYHSRSDTETVLHLFERFRTQSVERMRGMFAIAIWDAQERELFLARDRFGVKPLYYIQRANGDLLFASEIKALLSVPGVRPQLNMGALPDFLANHAPSGSDTLFAGIKRLPPGHTLLWRDGRVTVKEFWDLKYNNASAAPAVGSSAESALVDEYRERLTEAVRLRLMSDVPLGMFLSGGIDSAAITATMATLVREPIKTFSVAFAERQANELAYARLVAGMYKTDHHEVVVSPAEFFSMLPHLTWHEDEPLAHPSSIALYFVSQLAAKHVKVVLTGEGSDETLAGYNRYRFTRINAHLAANYERFTPKLLRAGINASVALLPVQSRFRQKVARTFLMREGGLDSLYFDNFAVFGRSAIADLLSPTSLEAVKGIDPYAAYHVALKRVSSSPLVSQLLYADTKTYLQELLMKQDQMSMAASIESRVPFLDHPLAEWVAALPLSMKLRGVTTKWILRAAMKGRLPEAIISRRKMGFPVPVGDWLRGPWRGLLDEYLCGERAKSRGLFASQAIDRLVQEHLAGVNHTERVWSLLTFEVWARTFLDGDAPWQLRLPVGKAA